jgi:probable F420-dependent oxidoreductase
MEIGVIGDVTDQTVGIAELARAVEEAGLESLFLTEHTHLPASRRELLEDDFHGGDVRLLDQFTVLGAASTVTTRIKLGTGICVVPQRDPIQLAKSVATIDFLTRGRFLFGSAAGWLVEEMRNHGVEPATRWELMAEQLSAMKAIWTQDEAEFHGRFVDFGPIMAWPKPVQRPHPPVLIGGSGERSLRLAAEHGDGWMPVVETLDEFDQAFASFIRVCDELGRAVPQISVCTMDANEETLVRYADLGVERCVLWVQTDNAGDLRARLDQCAALMGSVR